MKHYLHIPTLLDLSQLSRSARLYKLKTGKELLFTTNTDLFTFLEYKNGNNLHYTDKRVPRQIGTFFRILWYKFNLIVERNIYLPIQTYRI